MRWQKIEPKNRQNMYQYCLSRACCQYKALMFLCFESWVEAMLSDQSLFIVTIRKHGMPLSDDKWTILLISDVCEIDRDAFEVI